MTAPAPRHLQDLIEAFAAQYPECGRPALVADQCIHYSGLFLATLPAEWEPELIYGFVVSGGLIICGHAAVQVGATVVDWTQRQFNPAAAVPVVQPVEEWRATWNSLGGQLAPR